MKHQISSINSDIAEFTFLLIRPRILHIVLVKKIVNHHEQVEMEILLNSSTRRERNGLANTIPGLLSLSFELVIQFLYQMFYWLAMVKTESTQKLRKDQVAPDFTLKGTDEIEYNLESFSSSKLLLVVFICNHCPYVKARIHDLISLQDTFGKPDLQIVGINSNDPSYQDEGFENMKRFSQEYGLNFPYLIDDTQLLREGMVLFAHQIHFCLIWSVN